MSKNQENIQYIKIGRWFAEQRENARLTQSDVARALNYSTAQFISNWERGISLPPIVTLPALAEIYGISRKKMRERYEQQIDETCVQKKRKLKLVFHRGEE